MARSITHRETKNSGDNDIVGEENFKELFARAKKQIGRSAAGETSMIEEQQQQEEKDAFSDQNDEEESKNGEDVCVEIIHCENDDIMGTGLRSPSNELTKSHVTMIGGGHTPVEYFKNVTD